MLSYAIPLLYILFFNASLVMITKRSFGKCLPITMMLSAFLLFFSQLIFATFQVGFVLGIAFAASSVMMLLVKAKKRKTNEFKKLYFTSGFTAFLIVYVLVFVYDFARGFSVWDEFSHWGLMVKEMLRLDSFYSVDVSNLMVHKDYPPIMQLFELFWVKLSGGYKEAYLECALHTFELSLFIPLIAEKVAEKWNIIKSVLVSMAVMLSVSLLVVLFDLHGVFQTIYTDYVMALIVVYLLMTVLINKRITCFEIMELSVGGGFLLLLKQMGLPLYLMVLCFFAVMILVKRKNKIKSYLKYDNNWKLLSILVALLLPFVVWFIWGRATSGITKQFDLSSINIGDFVNVLLGGGEDWQRYTVLKYLNALGQNNLSTSFLPLSYIQGVTLFALLLWAVYRCFNLDKREILALGGIVVIGAVGYAATMLLLYVLSFGSYEGPILASYDRYMDTYMIVMFGLILAITIYWTTRNKKLNLLFLVTAGLALINTPMTYSKLYPFFIKGESTGLENYAQMAQDLKTRIEDGNAKVFIIAQKSTGAQYFLQYYATPIKVNSSHYSWNTSTEDTGKEFKENILPYITDYDYLYIVDANEEFKEAYCAIIDICPINKGEIFKINRNKKDEIRLDRL